MKYSFFSFPLLLALICLPLLTQNVSACSCSGRETPFEAFRQADTVFIGTATEAFDESGKKIAEPFSPDQRYPSREGTNKYHFAVQESLKGVNSSDLIVSSSINMCQFGFDLGETFLVYAYKSEDGLRVPLFCARTAELKWAQDDIHFIRELLANKPQPRIYGSVRLGDKDLSSDEYRRTGLPGIKVIAKSGSNRFETVTDENGLYRFYKLPDGKYEVSPELPTKYSEDDSDYERIYEITLNQDKYPGYEDYGKYFGGSAYSSFIARWSNSVSGTILDAEGKSLEKAHVTLVPISQMNKPLQTDTRYIGYFGSKPSEVELRKYKIEGRTPGAYVLAVEVFAPFVSGGSPLLMYYPQELSPDKAQVINLKELDNQTLNIKLPAGYNLREIEGELFAASGVPIKEGYVTLTKLENPRDQNNIVYDSESVKDGKFKFQVFENAEYWVHARDGYDESKPFKIRIGKTNAPLKIVILSTIAPKSPNTN